MSCSPTVPMKKHLNVGINISYVDPSWDVFSKNRGAQNLLIDQRLRLKIADFGLVGDTRNFRWVEGQGIDHFGGSSQLVTMVSKS